MKYSRVAHYLKLGLFLFVAVCAITVFYSERADALSGSSFNASHIIDDSKFFDSGTMGTAEIQNFLNAKVPNCDTNGTQASNRSGYATRADWGRANNVPPPYVCLKNYTQSFDARGADAYCGAIAGGNKSAANIIFDVSRACGVNPQTLIVLLQKEQSLISDDWPWPIQYRSATGYGCPDTAPCDSQYYGFFNQVYNAARQFKRYVQQPGSFNYAAGRTSFVQYNPNAGCGGSNLTLQNKATAALYNYTPYQPNQAALNNLYGTGDGCSAYGNRNFWRLFNDWFGATSGNGFVLAISSDGNDLRQWVVYRNLKQYVPSGEIKRAWNLPEEPTVFDAAYLNSIPTSLPLDRLFIINGDGPLYFADGGKRYIVASQAYKDIWNINNKVISNVSLDLGYTPTNGGWLSAFVQPSGSSTIYMLDGANGSQTVLRPYANASVFKAIEGENTLPLAITTDLYNYLNPSVGANLTTARFSNDSAHYMVFNGRRRQLTGGAASLYPSTAQAVSAATIERLPNDGSMTYMMQSTTTGTYYVVDGGTKRALANSDLANAWQAPGLPIMQVGPSFLGLIPDGSGISSYTFDVSGQMYLLYIRKKSISSQLDAAYRSALPPASVSATLAAYYPADSEPASRFFQEAGTPYVYMLDNTGHKHLITSQNTYNALLMWDAFANGIPLISGRVTMSIPVGVSGLGVYVTDGTQEYVMSRGKKLPVNAQAKTDWGLSNPQTLDEETLDAFTTGSNLGNMVVTNAYYLIKDGTEYSTSDASVGRAWNMTNATDTDPRLMSLLIKKYARLQRFVRSNSSSDYIMYIMDKGKWHRLRWEHFINLGGRNVQAMILAPDNSAVVVDWLSPIVKSESGTYYVMDNGGVRNFASTTVLNQWTNNQTLSVNTISNEYINLIHYWGSLERSVRAPSEVLYKVTNGQKQQIITTNPQTLAPHTPVSNELLDALQTGSAI